MTTVPVDIAAVVVTFNSERHIADLLDSIPAAMGDLTHSVVVVDNGSTDRTLEILDARTDCVVVRSRNDGYAAGMNRAVRSSPDASAILILNPDATLDRLRFRRCWRCCAVRDRQSSHPRARGRRVAVPDAATRADDGPSRRAELHRRGPPSPSASKIRGSTRPSTRWSGRSAPSCSSTRRATAALGGMDESYFLYSEETDFSLRAKDAGWATVYTPAAGAMHVGGGSGESATTHTMKILNRVRLYRRRRGTFLASIYFGLTVLTEVRRAILGHDKSWPTLRALVASVHATPSARRERQSASAMTQREVTKA